MGLQATVQDAGRSGMLASGITQGGAVDHFALRRGNRLVGNSPDCAGLEIVLAGATFAVAGAVDLAVTGAPVPIEINGQPIPMDTCVHAGAGDQICLGKSRSANYSYLSIAGGVDTPPVFGSRSTVVREALGGLHGGVLAPGDTLPLQATDGGKWAKKSPRAVTAKNPKVGQSLNSEALRLRFIPCIHYDRAAQHSRGALERQEFRVSGAANRMAIPLLGTPLQTGIEQLWSEATLYGSIQVPPSGNPLVLLNDRQTMGGYPQLGTIIPPDCVRLAQAHAGRRVRLEPISPERADEILWYCKHYEDTLLEALQKQRAIIE